ncbi:MAG: metallophosphoesterase [Candidatus Peribacteraceae bacterium]|nr:metallophosphoesterase [Candidatus Peribacteraceae bacterium]
MLLGIISDTHEGLEQIETAKKLFVSRGVETIIHLGDYCAGPSVRAFKGGPKLIGIFGNNDGDHTSIQRNFGAVGGEFKGHFCVLEYNGLKIACYHGTISDITEALILCGKYDVVLYGHTHASLIEKRGKVLVVNPGSSHGFEEGPPSVAILDTKTREAEIVRL